MILPAVFIIFFGLAIGSFLNCLIWRLINNESILGRSYCPKCKNQIAWYDNLPLISYVFLKAKCRHCKERISIQYPLVELATGILFLAAWYLESGIGNHFTQSVMQFPIRQLADNSQFPIALARDFFIISVMIVVFVIDLRWYLILDIVTIPAIIIAFVLNLLLGINWYILLISGIIGGSFFLLQYILSKGRWIGGGDIRLGILMGAALSWPNVILAIFLAYIIGSVVAIPLLISRTKGLKSELPLGVFLSTATVIILLFGNQIFNWYLGLLRA